MTYKELTPDQKERYNQYCDLKYGSRNVRSESGEPLYFDEHGNIVNTHIIFDLLFGKENKN